MSGELQVALRSTQKDVLEIVLLPKVNCFHACALALAMICDIQVGRYGERPRRFPKYLTQRRSCGAGQAMSLRGP